MSVKLKLRKDKGGACVDHIDSLYRYALTLTCDSGEAEDLVQETYVRALGAICRLRPDSDTKGRLFAILRRLWLNRWRHSEPQFVGVDGSRDGTNGIATSSKTPYQSSVSNVESDQVNDAIQQLPAEFREVIVLREHEDFSYREIAVILDCQPDTVMSRLAGARSRLRVLLASRLDPSNSVKTEDRNQTEAVGKASTS